ncbi:hypothetical protein TruAng_006129 [Truncatella angustata]|nr:hypothetical protein TruAng_006129 [Truncatella angustata]
MAEKRFLHDTLPNISTVLAKPTDEPVVGHGTSTPHRIQDATTQARGNSLDPLSQSQGEVWFPSTVASLLVPSPLGPGDTDHNAGETQAKPIASALDSLTAPVRGAIVKSRYSAPSNWMHSLLLFPDTLSWFDNEIASKGEVWQALQTCKSFCRVIKANQKLTWTIGDYGRHLPSKHTADRLIDAYLRTFESIYRIVHIPTFQHDYETLWEKPTSAPAYFVIQVQLCLALGVCLSRDAFSLRPQALQWVHEAMTWFSSSEKAGLSITGMQNTCLLELARRCMRQVHGDRAWIRSGTLLRSAMSIGLHRDPANLPGMPKAQTEIRRRLWATILELELDASLDAGGAPLISLRDYDCAIPTNLDDVQLDFDSDADLVTQDPTHRTDTSLQIAIARTFPVRLAIASSSNGIQGRMSYQEVVKLSDDFQTARRAFNAHVACLSPKVGHFQRLYCDMIMTRYIFALHIPYITVASSNPACLQSRDLCLDVALKMCHSSFHPTLARDPFLGASQAAATAESHCDEYTHLMFYGSGSYRAVLFQAINVVGSELVAISANCSGSSLSNTLLPFGSLRGLELLSLFRVGIEWSKHRTTAVQNDVKEFVIMSATLGGVNAAIKGSSIHDGISTAGKEACLEGLSMLTPLACGEDPIPEEPPLLDAEASAIDDFWTANWNVLQEDFFMTTS